MSGPVTPRIASAIQRYLVEQDLPELASPAIMHGLNALYALADAAPAPAPMISGHFDNTETQCRERWLNGRCTISLGWLQAEAFPGHPEPWGALPDLPKH